MRIRRRIVWILVPLILIVCCLVLWLRLVPSVQTLACAQVENEASDLIAEVISEEMEALSLDYAAIITLERNPRGELIALRTDMKALNTLRNEILKSLNQRLVSKDTSELGIPIGSVLAPSLLSGRGPTLPIRVLTVQNADAEFESNFQQAGINQTLHQIVLHIALNVTILTPAGTQERRIASDAVVAETIIIGSVPDSIWDTEYLGEAYERRNYAADPSTGSRKLSVLCVRRPRFAGL